MRFHVSYLKRIVTDVDCDAVSTRLVRALIPAEDGHPRAYDRVDAERIAAAFSAAGIKGARLEPAHPEADASMFDQ